MTNEEYTEEYFAKDDAAFARKFKRVFKILRNMIFGVIIAVAIFVLAFFIVPRFYAEYKCTQFGDQLLNCGLPLDSRIMAHEYKTANFSPAGDNMGFIAIALLESRFIRRLACGLLGGAGFSGSKGRKLSRTSCRNRSSTGGKRRVLSFICRKLSV